MRHVPMRFLRERPSAPLDGYHTTPSGRESAVRGAGEREDAGGQQALPYPLRSVDMDAQRLRTARRWERAYRKLILWARHIVEMASRTTPADTDLVMPRMKPRLIIAQKYAGLS